MVLTNAHSPVSRLRWRAPIQGFDWLGKAVLIAAVHLRGWSCQKGNGGNPEQHRSFTVRVNQVLKQAETPDALRKQRNRGISPLEQRNEMCPVFTYSTGMFLFPVGKGIKSVSLLLQIHLPLVPVLQKARSHWRSTQPGLNNACYSWFIFLLVQAWGSYTCFWL